MFLSHPLFGAGLGAFIGEQVRATGTPLIIHSTPVWLLAETGLVGFAVFFAAAWRIVSAEWPRRAARPARFLILIFGVLALMSATARTPVSARFLAPSRGDARDCGAAQSGNRRGLAKA